MLQERWKIITIKEMERMTGMMIGLAVYLLIGTVIAQLSTKFMVEGKQQYDEGLEQLLDKKNQAETYEEKAMIRDEIMVFDKKHEVVVENKQLLDLLDERVTKKVFALLVVAWLPLIIKVRMNKAK
jgi:hypothetical protein